MTPGRFFLILCLTTITIASACAQGTPFTSYSGDQSRDMIGPGTSPWADSGAVCTAPFPGRLVGLGIQIYSGCTFPNQAYLVVFTRWQPTAAPNTNWVIEGSATAVRNYDRSYFQHVAYAYSECDIASASDPRVADVVLVSDTDNGC